MNDSDWASRHGTREAEAWFTRQVRGTAPEPTPDGFLVPPGFAEDLMRAFRENLAAAGEWYASQAGPIAPPPWHRRIKRRISNWRERIAGYDVPEPQDW